MTSAGDFPILALTVFDPLWLATAALFDSLLVVQVPMPDITRSEFQNQEGVLNGSDFGWYLYVRKLPEQTLTLQIFVGEPGKECTLLLTAI